MNFTIYKSSAGSGKTFSLVKEYLKLILLDVEKYNKVLAVTFTNKAAAEMKSRIIEALSELSKDDIQNQKAQILKNAILDESKLNERMLKENARKCLLLILHNYSEFAVSTIDSFIHRIIKTFSYDLYLPSNFEVEMDEGLILSEAVDMIVEKSATDTKLTFLLSRFIEYKIREEKSWNIKRDISEFAKQLLKEETENHIRELQTLKADDFITIIGAVSKYRNDFWDSLSNKGKKAISIINNANLGIKDFYQSSRGIGVFFQNLQNKKSFSSNSYVHKTIEEGMWYSKSKDKDVIAKIESINHRLEDIYQQVHSFLEKEEKQYRLMVLLSKEIHVMAVLSMLRQMINEIKKEKGILLISEFNRLIANIVLNEPVPFIYERLGEHYKHFLIDEFQDTSVLQFHNVLPLLHNSLSYSNFNMVVGDAKQAIYRFRNGQHQQFISLPKVVSGQKNEIITERENSLVRNHKIQRLEHNYRSKKELVEFNNQFFSFVSLLLPEIYQKAYEDVIQIPHNESEGGYVQIDFYDKEKQDIDYEDYNCENVYETILELQQDDYRLSDIAVLCRTKKQIGIISSFLNDNSIEILSAESLLLKNSQEVQFLISFLYYFTNPFDVIREIEMISYLCKKKIIKTPFAEIMKFFDARNHKPFRTMIKYFEKNDINLKSLYYLSLYELCESIIQKLLITKSSDPFVLFFLENVLQFQNKKQSGISQFLEWWEEKKENLFLQTSAASEAVNILTIHKSKGLEFPVVIYPFADEKVRAGKDYLWTKLNNKTVPALKTAAFAMKKDLLETEFADEYEMEIDQSKVDLVNLLYVAFTRAGERLYIFSKIDNKKDKKDSEDEVLSIPFVLKQFLKNSELLDEECSTYSFGNKAKHISAKETADNAESLDEYKASERKARYSLKFSALEDWDVANPDKNLRWGSIVHQALSIIITPNDMQKAVNEMLQKCLISAEEVEDLLQNVRIVINHPQLFHFFTKKYKIRNEAELITKEGKSYRPDRLAFHDNQVVIIDYKTGSQSSKHKTQILNYASLLSELNYEILEKKLVYINEEVEVIDVE